MDKVKIFAYLKLILTIVIWGSIYHVATYLVQDADIFTVAFVRFFISSIVLLGIFYQKHKHIIIIVPKNQLPLLLLTGVVGIFGYTTLFFYAESLISGNQVAIIFSFAPCLTVIFSRFYLKQRIPVMGYLGILVALFGTIAVINYSSPVCEVGSSWNFIKHLSLGQVLAMGTAFFMAIYNVLNRRLIQNGVESLTLITVATLTGMVLLLINFIIFGKPMVSLLHKPLMFWIAMIYTSVLATAICYKWYSDAICKIGVPQSAVFLNGVPLSAVIIGVILGDIVNMGVAISGLIIILGVIITNYSVNNYLKRVS